MGQAAAEATGKVLGTVGNIVQADALGSAAAKQSQTAIAQQQKALDLAKATPQEIANLEQLISANTKDLERRQQLIDSADPALLEIGKQTLGMLRGDADVLGSSALNKNRAKQRTALENQLRQQLGPGYANTSAGIQALAEFDSASADLTESNRLNVINSYLPTLANISSSGIQNNVANAGTIGNLAGNIQNRQVGAATGTAGNVINTSGADYVRQYQYGDVISKHGAAMQASGGGGGSLKDLFAGMGGSGGGAGSTGSGGTSRFATMTAG